MTILRRPARFAVLAACTTLVLCLTAAAFSQETGEDVAVLYAHDGDALYHVDPNSGVLTEIGALDRHFGPFHGPTSYGSMVYDGKQHKLYAYATYQPDPGVSNEMIVEIDPHTAAGRDVVDNLPSGPSSDLSYDWRTGQLVTTIKSTPAWTGIENLDPETGQITVINRGFGIEGFPWQTSFFDAHGFFWQWAVLDYDRYLTKYDVSVPDGKQLHRIEGRVQGPGDPPRDSDWPRYQSFAFDPYTSALFATFRTFEYPGGYGDFHTSLCIIDISTGKPHKVIAQYDRPNWSFTVTWGLNH